MPTPPLFPQTPTLNQRLGRSLAIFRKRAKLTQPQVAERLRDGTAVETVSRIERGVLPISIAWIEKLADLYKVGPDEIVQSALLQGHVNDDRRALHEWVDGLQAEELAFARTIVTKIADAVLGAF